MKLNRKLIICTSICLAFFGTTMNAQLDDRPEYEDNFNSLEQSRVFINDLMNTENTTSRNTSTSSEVFINQIGNYNSVVSNTTTKNSTINIQQTGNSNEVDLNVRSNTYFANIVQDGDRNKLRDVVNNSRENATLNLTQEGRNLNFQRYGTNSITEKLQFKMSGTNKTLIIKSIK